MTRDARFESARTAARRWRVSRSTVIAWCRRGHVAGAKLVPIEVWDNIVRAASMWVIPVGTPMPHIKKGRPLKDTGGPIALAARAARRAKRNAPRHTTRKLSRVALLPKRERKPRGVPSGPQAARQAVARAVRETRLVRPKACSKCGLTRGVIQAHHHKGYEPAHQLDVQWLCAVCHFAVHK